MKKTLKSFVTGALTALVIGAATVTALATGGAIKIEVSPIKVLVNDEVFQPKDANGNDVMVFTYNGTTYAPLRALAEAYGLEVGYDSTNHIATVNAKPTDATVGTGYANFENAWTVKEKPVTNYGNEKIFTISYSGKLGITEFREWWKSFDAANIKKYAERMASEIQSTVPDYTVTAYFSYGQYNLGTAYAFGDYEGSDFAAASIWIK